MSKLPLTDEERTLALARAEQRKWNDAVGREYSLIWESQRDGQDANAARVLASQIDDTEILCELVAMLATSAWLLHDELETLRAEVE